VSVACVYIDDGLAATGQDWLAAFDVNVVAGVMLLKAARPIMAACGGGAVVATGPDAILRRQ
jgi:NAD(P)-dependent dehydrogenase (short-subunit alcohol dehydrogenase family)